MADNVLGIVFGVAGGESISGESGALIRSQLSALTDKIKLKVNIDRNHFSKQLDSLRKELDNKLGGLKITINPAVSSSVTQRGKSTSSKNSTSEVQNQTAVYDALRAKITEATRAYKAYGKELDTTTNKSNSLLRTAETLHKEYETQLSNSSGILSTEQVDTLNGLNARLEEVRNNREAFNKAIQQDKMNGGMRTSYDGLIANIGSLSERYSDLIKNNKTAFAEMQKLQALAKTPYAGEDHIGEDGNLVPANYENAVSQIKRLAQESKVTASTLSKIKVETDTLGKKIKDTFNSKILQSFAYVLIGAMTRAISQVYTNVVALDAAVTDLQIATGKTREETAKLVIEYAKLAKEVGVSVTEVTAAADTWLRQGYSVAETNLLIRNTLMLAKLGQLESAEASQALTSAMKGYKVSVEDSIKVVDKFTAVDMEAAVSAGDIATAMAETAAGADIAGISMDKLIGYISVVKEVTQDGAESVGTFYKTLFARMGNVKAGKFVDEATGEDLNDVEKILGRLGISLRDETGLFRDFSKVLDEVGDKWDSYDNVQQHALATAFAGTRQQEKFIVLMENYAKAIEYANVAANSEGTAQKKYDEAYLNSIEAAMNRLKSSWQQFSMTLLDSDLVKFFLNLLSTIANVLNGVFSFADGFAVKMVMVGATVASVVGIIHKVFGKNTKTFTEFASVIKTQAKSIGVALKQMASNPYVYVTLLIGLFATFSDKLDANGQLIVGSLMAIAVGVTAFFAVVNQTVRDFMMTNPLGWFLALATAAGIAIASLVKHFQSVSNASTIAMKNAVKQAKESKEAWEEVESQLDNVSGKLDETRSRLDELQRLSNEGVITLVQQEELERLQKTILQLENEKKLLESVEAVKRKTAEQDASKAVSGIFGEKLSDAYVQGDDNGWTRFRRIATSILTFGISDAVGGYGISNLTNKKTNAGDYVKSILGNWESATAEQQKYALDFYNRLAEQKDMLSYHTGDNLEQWQKDANKAYNLYYEYSHRFLLANGEAESVWASVLSMERFPDIKKILKEFANAGDVTSESINSLYNSNGAFKELIDYLIDIGMYSWDDANKVTGLVNQIKQLADAAQVLTKISFLDALEGIEQKFDALNNVLESIADNGIASADSISKLLKEFPSLEKYFKLTNQGYVIGDNYAGWSNEDILRDFTTQYLQSYVDALSKCEEGTDNYAIAQENLNNAIAVCATLLRSQAIKKATEDLENQRDALDDQLKGYQDLIQIRKDLLKSYKDELNYQKQLEEKQRKVADLQTQLALVRLDTSAAGKAKAKELEQEIKDAQEELDDFTLEKAVEELTKELDEQAGEYEKFIKGEVDRIEAAIKDIAKSLDVDIVLPSPTPEKEDSSKDNNTSTERHSPWASYEDAARAGFANIADGRSSEGIRVLNWENPYTGEKYKSYQEYLDAMYRKYVGEYHTGGFVGDKISIKNNEAFAKLMKGELVVTPTQMSNFMNKTLPSMRETAGGVQYNAPLINMECESISNESLPEVKRIITDAVQKVRDIIDSAFSRTGYRNGSDKFSIQ